MLSACLLLRRAFLDPYAKYDKFHDGNGSLIMDEFIDAREVVQSLSAEYEACERQDYVSAEGIFPAGLLELLAWLGSCASSPTSVVLRLVC